MARKTAGSCRKARLTFWGGHLSLALLSKTAQSVEHISNPNLVMMPKLKMTMLRNCISILNEHISPLRSSTGYLKCHYLQGYLFAYSQDLDKNGMILSCLASIFSHSGLFLARKSIFFLVPNFFLFVELRGSVDGG